MHPTRTRRTVRLLWTLVDGTIAQLERLTGWPFTAKARQVLASAVARAFDAGRQYERGEGQEPERVVANTAPAPAEPDPDKP